MKEETRSHFVDIKGSALGWFVAGGLLAASLATVAGQAPVFRSGVDLVTVDVNVVAHDGRPIQDLGVEDFALTVDGRSRRLVSAQFVSQGGPRSAIETLDPAHVTTNELADAGRFVVVAVDEAHIRRLEGRAALAAAARFIETLDPVDYVAATGLTRLGAVTFTRDRASVKRRIETLVGQTDPVFLQFTLGLSESLAVADGSRATLGDVVLRECGRSLAAYTSLNRAADDATGERDACPEQVEQEARAVAQHARTQARISVSALQALVASLADVEGPKLLVLLSEGLVADPRLLDFAELAAAAQAARVSIYVLQMDQPLFEAAQPRVSPTFLQDQQIRGDGLGRLAGSARGAMFRLVGSDPRPFERIRRELSGYYLLAFEALPTDRDGRVHRIGVSLAHRGGEVRARQAFRVAPVATSPRVREEEIVSLLRASRTATELPVRVATATYGEPGSSRLRVVVSTEAEATGDLASGARLGYVLIDESGVIVASSAHRSDLGRHAFSTLVAPGKYTLRVAAIDPLGRRGSLERPFVAALQRLAGMRVSDVILAAEPAQPEAPLHPLIDRIQERRVVAYLELYADRDTALQRVTVQVAVAADVDRPPLITVPAEVSRRDGGWAIARATLALADLDPGRYVAWANVLTEDGTMMRVVRPFSVGARE